MGRVIGICNLHDDPSLGLLTTSRPLGAVTFLGRYGLIDFTLSNFSNSGIDKMYVLVKNGMLPIKNHIGSGSIWNNNTITGSLSLLINEEGLSNPKFNTDIANLKANLRDSNFDYAVIAPSFILASINYVEYINKHIDCKNDISVLYSKVTDAKQEYTNCDNLQIINSEVVGVKKNTGNLNQLTVSIESFIISKNALLNLINDASQISETYNLRDIISYKINNNGLRINALEFKGFFAPILDLEHYITYSFKMLDYKISSKLFVKGWPIYTTTHNTPPAIYGSKAQVNNSFIANGAIINGKVKNSIISRDVYIDEKAEVTNCIIFTGSIVGKDVKMKYVLTDKEVNVSENKSNIGKPEQYLYYKHGAKI